MQFDCSVSQAEAGEERGHESTSKVISSAPTSPAALCCAALQVGTCDISDFNTGGWNSQDSGSVATQKALASEAACLCACAVSAGAAAEGAARACRGHAGWAWVLRNACSTWQPLPRP